MIIEGKCGICGGKTTRDLGEVQPIRFDLKTGKEIPNPVPLWTPPACAECDPIEKAHPLLFAWVQKVITHQLDKEMESHLRGHAASDYTGYLNSDLI